MQLWTLPGSKLPPEPVPGSLEAELNFRKLGQRFAIRDVLYSDGRKGVHRSVPRAEIGMEKMGEQLGAIHHARAGASEVGICIYGKDSVVANRRDFAPTRLLQKLPGKLYRSLGVEAAWRNNQHFRRP